MTSPHANTHPHMNYLNSRTALPVMAQAAVAFAVMVTKWSGRRRSRYHLRHLNAAQLKDIGLTREEAHYEGTLPFWRP